MSTNETNLTALPLLPGVDVLVVGGTAAAVEFALGAQRAGRQVLLVAPQAYLGEDICAAYRFWPEASDSVTDLGYEIFGDLEVPPTPLHVKRTLEQNLVRAGVPFLLNCQPAGILAGAGGKVSGIVLANRSGRQGIRAALVVDATLDGRVLSQAGVEGVIRPRGLQKVEWITLVDTNVIDESKIPGERLTGFPGGGERLAVRRRECEVNWGDGSAETRARALSALAIENWRPGEFRHSAWVTPLGAKPSSLRLPEPGALWSDPGLLALNESMPLEGGLEAVFRCPLRAMKVARDAAAHLPAARPADSDVDASVYCAGAQPLAEGRIHSVSDALRPGLATGQSLLHDPNVVPVLGSFDVVVVGGGTGGAPAGISAARAGARTLVVEVTSGLGGVGTMGQIAKYWCGNRVGFTAEIDQGVTDLEVEEHFKKTSDEWSVGAKSAWYQGTAHREGATLWFQTLCLGTWVVGGRVRGVLLAGPFGYGLVEAGCVVDATGCADIPAAAGAPTVMIGDEHVAVQGTGLAGINPGRNYRNSDHNFSDDTDVVDTTAFLVSAKLKFGDEFDCGELIDSRERRQILGDLVLEPVDVLYQRRFPDTICVATSNFDSHGFTIHPVFMLVPPDKKTAHWADVPLRALLPRGLDGVLVTGLGLSAHRDVLPVVRMQPDVQNQGYAAGYIAAKSALGGRVPLRALDIRPIQVHLVQIGSLPPRVLNEGDSFPVPEERLHWAVSEGWDELSGLSLLLAEKSRALPLLQAAFAATDDPRRRRRYAHVLALLDDPSGAAELIGAVNALPWDIGWNFRGMHQFGMSMSEVDALLIAVGKVAGAEAWACILEKIATLPETAEFSHYRALSAACEALHARHPNPAAAEALAALLQRPGLRGNAQLAQTDAQAAVSDDLNDNTPRNNALRELHLARGLYLSGDHDGLGRQVLEEYANDLRGHFARHARAVLALRVSE
jgi:NADPH-dependent 2,4-dienoyl-CoA reductase/sulfur reductase-like enzyme